MNNRESWSSQPLSPTPRTTLTRLRERGLADRAALVDVLDSTFVCHLGVVVDGAPRVMPTAFGVDYEGPDRGGSLYLHGSVAARSLVEGTSADICVTFTVLDGLVLARSGFHHSMNYRSAVVHGRARLVDDPEERGWALDSIVDHIVAGRSGDLRPHTKKEMAATVVLALPLFEASVKARTGGPQDDDRDVQVGGVWAGVVSTTTAVGHIVTADDVEDGVGIPRSVGELQTR